MSRFQLRELRVDNYRCFDELTLTLEEDTTILFAENGGGKTALLTALAMGLAVIQRDSPTTLKLRAGRDSRRGVSNDKGAPEPASLREAEDTCRAELPGVPNPASFARSEFNRLEKRKLRAVMYREQHSLCIYCERRVVETHPAPRIDHWYPLGREPELALHWNNLYLSCTKPDTCDSAKAGHPFRWADADSRMPWPVDLRYEDIVGFTTRGEIYIRSDVPLSDTIRQAVEFAIAGRADGDRVLHGIVNLNDPALVKARVAAVRGERKRMERDYRERAATGDEREERAAQLLGRSPLPAFVSIRIAWLRKTLGRGR